MVQDISTGPRQQQSNFTVGPDHPNAGMQLFSNFTGSITWYRRVIERMLGVWADFDALVIRPCPPSDWKEYEIRKHWRRRRIHVRLRRNGPAGCRVTLNGRPCADRIPLSALSDTKLNSVAVDFG